MRDDSTQAGPAPSEAARPPSGRPAGTGGPETRERPVPIVGVGASAGGLRAFTEFFAHLPDRPGLAFVVVQHLAPHHESELAELLQNHTRMKVMQAEDGQEVRADCVYVIPPARNLEVRGSRLALSEPPERRGARAPIDHFFRTLARERGEEAVCIVLSGTGSDGSQGLGAMKEANGITMAQDPADAEHAGMPQAAVRTGLVDVLGTPAELAERLMALRERGAGFSPPEAHAVLPADDHDALDRVLARVFDRTGHDFSRYKRSTILRRIGRRMQIHQRERIADYLALVQARPDELDHLFHDFIISVTRFFRDPEVFAALEAEVVPRLFEGKGPRDRVRVWVPGCATGEEAYGIAMVLQEHASRLDAPPRLQVFATDIDEQALAVARRGLYPRAVGADVPRSRLRRFFREKGEQYRVEEELRDLVLFAPHNLLEDPPFSHIDLVSCRNLLIYLERDVQRTVFELFHYALRAGGILLLGPSESADGSPCFSPLDKARSIYVRREGPAIRRVPPLVPTAGPRPRSTPTPGGPGPSVEDLYAEWTLRRHAPPRLLVDGALEIRYSFGGVGDYLRDPEGAATQNLLDRVLPALQMDLRVALHHVLREGEEVETRPVPLPGPDGAPPEVVRMHVGRVELPGVPEELVEVVFHPMAGRLADAPGDGSEPETGHLLVQPLKDELDVTRRRLQATVEDYEASNEELKASNEELQSMNEELQSATEELETSREELQSMNEELATVNQELHAKIEELSRSNSDLENLIASTGIGTLFLDRELRLKRFTPGATELFNLIPSDLGRPFQHVSHEVAHDHLPQVAADALEQMRMKVQEVASVDGETCFLMRASPYRTADDRIDGVVMTFVDITPQKRAQGESARRARQQAAIAELGQRALVGGDLDELLEVAVRLTADVLDAGYAKVLEHRPAEADLLLRAGVGWDDGLVGTAVVPDERGSQAGYTLLLRDAVTVEDVEEEKRFTPPALLTDHGIRSGMSVAIRTPASDQPYGVLGVHDQASGRFSADDAGFVESVANVLAEAIARTEAENRQREQNRTIREQLQEIESIYATAPVGLCFHDADFRYVRINAQLAEINGLSVEEHLGRRAPELLPELNKTLLPLFEQVLETGEPVLDREIRGATPRDPDSERVWIVSYVPVRSDGEELVGINVMVQDVTERVRTVEALAEATDRLREAQRIAGLGFWSYDPVSGSTVWSEEMYRIFGYDPAGPPPPSEIIWAQFDPAHLDALQALYAKAVHTGESYEGEWRIRLPGAPGQEWRWIRTRTRSAPVPGGDGFRIFGVVLDVTDEKETLEALRTSHLRLEEVNAELERLNEHLEQRVQERTAQVQKLASDLTLAEQRERRRIAQILHDDLQQYLYGLLVQVDLLKRDLDPEGAASAKLDGVARLATRAIDTTRSLSVDLSPPVLSSDGLEQAVQWLALQMKELHGLRVRVDVDGTFAVPSGDMRLLLFQLVRELLFNVVKHAGVEEARVALSETEGEHRIVVSDDGAGFDPDASMEPSDGGFGLYSVRERLALFGGRLSIEAADGAGTRVTIGVPRGLP